MDVYVSSGDINGTSLELILQNHEKLCKKYNLIYCIDKDILKQAKDILNIKINLHSLNLISVFENLTKRDKEKIKNLDSKIMPGIANEFSGFYSFKSFEIALKMSLKSSKKLLTMPINKYAWNMANIKYKGHTDFLRHFFKKEAIMMLGNKKMFVALFSDHIPLKDVAKNIKFEKLNEFFKNFYESFLKFQNKQALILGLNPHAGDNGLIGKEDFVILESIQYINEYYKKEIFIGPISPDAAFIKQNREKFSIFVAMYHDAGLAPLKALYFDDSINVSLNLEILRTSPDHGSGYDIAYKNSSALKSSSYIQALDFIKNAKV